jgi:hypothetical protein
MAAGWSCAAGRHPSGPDYVVASARLGSFQSGRGKWHV